MIQFFINYTPAIAYISLIISLSTTFINLWNSRYNLEIEPIPDHTVIYTDSKYNPVQNFRCDIAFLAKNKSRKPLNINSIILTDGSTSHVSEYDSRFVTAMRHDYPTPNGKETDTTIVRSTAFPIQIPAYTNVLITAKLIFPVSFLYDQIKIDTDKGIKDITIHFPHVIDKILSIKKDIDNGNSNA